MKILLDTHILIWFHTHDRMLSERALDILLDSSNDIYYSSVNIWETQMKHLKHKDEINFAGEELHEMCICAGLQCLHLTPKHCIELNSLKYATDAPRPHNDPFDKMLLCQAKSENMFLMTHDSLIPYYNEQCVMEV